MNLILEEILIYGAVVVLCAVTVWLYMRLQNRRSRQVEEKIIQAKTDGVFEPVSLHPVIDLDTCIGSGACVTACPEKDILGLRNGKATLINASSCVGHGACFHACPVQAITLCIGTEKRGVDLPHVDQTFETNVEGVYIAGELGGMGLIKNSVEQGKQAMDNIARSVTQSHKCSYDVVIVGAGPAGISAALNAKKHGLTFTVLEQDTLGGTVFTFPRSKIVMTSPMSLPLHGKLKLHETSKQELLELWQDALGKNDIQILERRKVQSIDRIDACFEVKTTSGEVFDTARVLLAIGRRGSPRKLGVPGEDSTKVAYRLIEPELIKQQNVLVVGGGDSAVEAAMALMHDNTVTLSYRSEAFKRIKPKNREKINNAISEALIEVCYNTNVQSIESDSITMSYADGNIRELANDRVFIFAGGEMPTKFLEGIGIKITTRFGHALLKHKDK